MLFAQIDLTAGVFIQNLSFSEKSKLVFQLQALKQKLESRTKMRRTDRDKVNQ